MPFSRFCLMGVLAVLVGCLTACGGLCHWDELGAAARSSRSVSTGEDRPPPGRWVENPDVRHLLEEEIKIEGMAAVVSKYGMQCSPAATRSDCADCRVCTASRRQWADMFSFPVSWCEDSGEVLIRAEIGPASAVKATTYWQRTPPVRR